jgi:hypothetical protein
MIAIRQTADMWIEERMKNIIGILNKNGSFLNFGLFYL